MRVLTWIVLVLLAVASFEAGRPALAVAFAGVKALLVGLEFMELKQAHRAHVFAFGAAVVFAVGLLALLVAR